MSDKPKEAKRTAADVVHLPKRRAPKSISEQISEAIDLSIAGHFREQNAINLQLNADLKEQVQRLMTGIDKLVVEMNGVRTGTKDEAFARVAPVDAPADLPTVAAEAALLYTETSSKIAAQLGMFKPSQIGLLLSARGLGWVGNGDYQEIGRWEAKPSQVKFWHREVPERLRAILDEGKPERFGITDKAVLTMFRKWKTARDNAAMLENMDTDSISH